MIGDPGPYIGEDGPEGTKVMVPRTVSYLRARKIAQEANYDGDRLTYLGKQDATLYGFTRDCLCEDRCEAQYPFDEESGGFDDTGEEPCLVPVWAFELVEP